MKYDYYDAATKEDIITRADWEQEMIPTHLISKYQCPLLVAGPWPLDNDKLLTCIEQIFWIEETECYECKKKNNCPTDDTCPVWVKLKKLYIEEEEMEKAHDQDIRDEIAIKEGTYNGEI